MKLKELIRVTINTEMEAVSAYEVEAETFGPAHKFGAEVSALYTRLAMEKRARLKVMGGFFKEGTGFRKRHTEPARSVEASLRTNVSRSEKSLVLYADLYTQLTKQVFRDGISVMLVEERAGLEALKALQARIKQG